MKKQGKGSTGSGRDGGYGNPPKHSQFKKGQSGYPSGRPKGAKNKAPKDSPILAAIKREASRDIKIRESGKELSISLIEAIVRAVFIAAANGSIRAQKLATELALQQELRERETKELRFSAAYQLKADWAKDSRIRRQRGETDPVVFPNPDDIILDYETGEVAIKALTPEQEELIGLYADLKALYEVELMHVLYEDHDPELLPQIIEELRHIVRVIKGASANVGVPWADKATRTVDHDMMSYLIEKVSSDLAKGTPPFR